MSSNKSYFDTDVLDRLKQTLELATDSELARFLDVKPTAIANWRSRGRINTTRVLSKCESLDLNWILFGKIMAGGPGSRYRSYAEQEEVVEHHAGQREQVREESEKDLAELCKAVELENVKLRSKIEALEDLIIRFKKDTRH